MPSEPEAVEALVELGLSEYEARCFVALTQLSEATAKEISQVADVPQSRVYDVTDQLHELGLVDIEQSNPMRFSVLPVDRALATLREEYTDALSTAETHLETLEGRERDDEGVWEIAHREDVRIRLSMHVDHATADVYLLVAHEELLDDDLLEALADARARGVAVAVEVPSASARQRVHDAVPDSRVAVTDFSAAVDEPGGQRPGRLLMVDEETILLSARREGVAPSDLEETGIWGTAVGHGLVVWIRQILSARRDRLSFRTASD